MNERNGTGLQDGHRANIRNSLMYIFDDLQEAGRKFQENTTPENQSIFHENIMQINNALSCETIQDRNPYENLAKFYRTPRSFGRALQDHGTQGFTLGNVREYLISHTNEIIIDSLMPNTASDLGWNPLERFAEMQLFQDNTEHYNQHVQSFVNARNTRWQRQRMGAITGESHPDILQAAIRSSERHNSTITPERIPALRNTELANENYVSRIAEERNRDNSPTQRRYQGH